MTPELIAAIRDDHQPKPHREYTDCGLCLEEWPCQIITALDALAASEARADALAAANQRLTAESNAYKMLSEGQDFLLRAYRLQTRPPEKAFKLIERARALLAELPGAEIAHGDGCEAAP